jgi:hypothetical protein
MRQLAYSRRIANRPELYRPSFSHSDIPNRESHNIREMKIREPTSQTLQAHSRFAILRGDSLWAWKGSQASV